MFKAVSLMRWTKKRGAGHHRYEVGDLVFTPSGSADAGTLTDLLGPGAKSPTVDRDDRQPRGNRRLGHYWQVPRILDSLIAIALQLPAHFVGDPPNLPLADVNLSLVGERLRGSSEGGAADGGAGDLTKDRRRDIVRVEPQTRAQRGKNPGDRSGNGTRVRRTGWSRREPEWSAAPMSADSPAHT